MKCDAISLLQALQVKARYFGGCEMRYSFLFSDNGLIRKMTVSYSTDGAMIGWGIAA